MTKPITAALAVLLLALCACHRGDASGVPVVSASLPGAALLPEPLPAELPPPAPAPRADPSPAPSAEELAAFHAPVPK